MIEAYYKTLVQIAGKKKNFTIVITQVDPDAIGAAFGMDLILGGGNTIIYSGGVSHAQNRALCNRFNLLSQMTHVRDVSMEQLENVVLVDSCKGNDSRFPFQLDPLIMIDHHLETDLKDSNKVFYWLDSKVGSASTMVCELLRESGLDIPKNVALMLALGVYTDTKSNVATCERDRDAYGWAVSNADYSDLVKLIRYKRSPNYLKHLAAAVSNQKSGHGGRLLATPGTINVKDGDDLSSIADEFLRQTGVTVAIIWAVVEADSGERIRVSARSEDMQLDLSDFLRRRFDTKCGAKQLPDWLGEGGASFELDSPSVWIKRDELIGAIGRRLEEWLFDSEEV